MTTEILATPDITTLSASLKKRIQACCNSGGKRNGKATILLPTDLRQDLLEAIDLLVIQAQASEHHSTESTSVASQTGEPSLQLLNANAEQAVCGLINDVIDDSLAAWQAQIVSSFEQAAARELHQQLSLANQLANDLTQKTHLIEEQRCFFEEELAQTLQMKARLARQRKTLALHVRTQRAELAAAIATRDTEESAGFEQERDSLRQQIASLQTELEQCQQRASSTEQQLANAAEQIVCTEQQLAHSKTQIANTEQQLVSAEQQLAQAAEQLNSITEQLARAEEQLASRQEQLASEGEQTELMKVQQDELLLLREQLQIAEDARQAALNQYQELLDARATTANLDAHSSGTEEIELLEQRLYDQQLELLDLRAQNSDLASQVAKYQMTATSVAPHVSFNQESLSWEERKQLIMQQLDADAAAEEADEATLLRHLEVEDILSTTQKEIERRDREIAELQSIIEQQSSARDGVAIGAAAIAQMLDADDLVNQERQKLKDIQREWEDKLRQAEIDLSMERAKLARERSQLETELEQARKSATTPVVEIEGQTKAQARTRKWLEHLGLKENRKHES